MQEKMGAGAGVGGGGGAEGRVRLEKDRMLEKTARAANLHFAL